jgi:hypothetical protein
MPSIKRKYIVILLLFPVLLVLWVGYRLGFFRHINEDEIPGTYVANTDWGSSSLTIARDHTFHQSWHRGYKSRRKMAGDASVGKCLWHDCSITLSCNYA